MPKELQDVDSKGLNPRNAWANKDAFDATARKLAGMFIDNLKKSIKDDNTSDFTQAGPQI
ncbi:MAG: hypothetical protein K0A93_01830 [Desulfuromonadaceae bacterium]|nr:hypothetical protein [Desulfuromonadaceae bacterium]